MVDIRARFRPHPRGFGFLTPVGAGGVTPTTFQAQTPGGTTSTFDQAFTPPQLATTLVADDLVDAVVEIDDKGAAAKQVALVDRPRRMLVGVVQPAAGQLVLEADQRLTAGWVELDDVLAHQLSGAIGRQVVVLGAERPDDGPLGRALVAGPHVAGSPDAVRARAVVVALDRAAPSLVPGGAEAAGLEPVETATTHTRLVGLLAGGGRGAAHELATEGPVPGSELIPADRRDEPCVTVDAASTRDLDDAVAASWDGGTDTPVRVAVHIADVGGTVGVDSAADVYARTVATSAYLTAGPNAPMLDPALSEDALSLLPDEDRQTVSVRFSVTPEGTLEDVVVETALARSRAQVTYAALDAWLTGQPDGVRTLAEPEADVVNTLLEAAAEASRRLGAERDARATLEDLFEQAEVEPAVVEGKLTTVDAEPHAAAYRLVERLMVAANEAVASWLVARDVPALYRAHVGLDPERAGRLRAAAELAGAEVPALASDDTPDADAVMAQVLAEIDRLQAEGRDEDREVLVAAATSSTARATYDPDPSHHRGLAATPYCHFTSPIRRYADLVVHRQIRAALAEESPPHPLGSLGALATWLDARTGAVNHAQALERAELWAQLVDRGFLDGAEPAVVTGVNPAGLRVRLPRLGLNGFVTAERALDLPAGERGKLEVDGYGLSTTSGPWRLGTRVMVRAAGLDDTGRPIFRLGEVPARA